MKNLIYFLRIIILSLRLKTLSLIKFKKEIVDELILLIIHKISLIEKIVKKQIKRV